MDQQQPAKMKDLSTYNTEEKEAVEVAKLIRSCLFAINNLFATNDLFATNTKKIVQCRPRQTLLGRLLAKRVSTHTLSLSFINQFH